MQETDDEGGLHAEGGGSQALLDQEFCGYWALTRASQREELSFGQCARSKCARKVTEITECVIWKYTLPKKPGVGLGREGRATKQREVTQPYLSSVAMHLWSGSDLLDPRYNHMADRKTQRRALEPRACIRAQPASFPR
jgi:hypothetical protein